MDMSVSEEFWNTYIKWYTENIGNVSYKELEDTIVAPNFLGDKISYKTIGYQNSEPVVEYHIYSDHQYFQMYIYNT